MPTDRTPPAEPPAEPPAAPGRAGETSGPALELLVHGVGGATPQEMLRDPRTERVTGDHTAAVYRRTEDVGAEERPREAGSPAAVPEAYCWSNLTSGNSARALWLLLLPFMVVNLAHWMRPAAAGRTGLVRAHGMLLRLLALSLTVLLVAAACEVALDLVAWQCAGAPRCAAERSWLAFMAPDASGSGGWWSQPGRRLLPAAVLPTALTALLWWLSRRTWSAYEAQPPWHRPSEEASAETARPAGEPEHLDRPAGDERPDLRQPGFWYGRRLVARLRAAHTAAGLLTVATALTVAAGRHDHGPAGGAGPAAVGVALQLMLAAGAVAVLATVCSRGRGESSPDRRRDGPVSRHLAPAAAVLLVLSAVYAAWPRPGWQSSGRLPGDDTFAVLAVVQGLLVAAVAVLGRLLHRSTRVPRTALSGLGSAATAMVACALAGVMSGGVAQRVADWLDGGATPGTGEGPIPGPPTVLAWQAAVTPLLLALVLALLVAYALRVWRSGSRIAERAHLAYPGAEPDAARSARIGRTVAAARLTDSAPRVLGVTALATMLLGGAAVTGALLTGRMPGAAADGAPPLLDGAADAAQALGSWLMGFGFLLLLTLGRRAYRDASTRRTVGILWDVGTFWPRAAHPFAPPCYAERAVPDLVWRMATWTRRYPGGRLVLSGHSQGSVLAAAAVWQLDPATRGQVALLTYGSPLARLYGRWFPAYFGPGPIRALRRELDCWRNLWRGTDPIGGPVRTPDGDCGEVDRGPLLDPLAYGRTSRDPLPAPILGHGEYQADPAFAEERAALLARLCPPAGPALLPAQPGPVAQEASAEGRSSG